MKTISTCLTLIYRRRKLNISAAYIFLLALTVLLSGCGLSINEPSVIYDSNKSGGILSGDVPDSYAAESSAVAAPPDAPDSIDAADASAVAAPATNEPAPTDETQDADSTDANIPGADIPGSDSSADDNGEPTDSQSTAAPTDIPGLLGAFPPDVIAPPEVVTFPPDVIAPPEVVTFPPQVPVPAAVDYDTSALSNEKTGWYFNRNSSHEPPTGNGMVDLSLYGSYYLGDTSRKIVYLTFDTGYENGFTGQILDTLKEKNVRAAFFLTRTYIRDEPELVARMAADGHTLANHSSTHPSFPSLTDEELAAELNDTAAFLAETTGYTMEPFFRPPAGEYSERTLALTHKLGYATIFWSFAHEDWLVDKQPPADVTLERVMNGLHNGMVILLHAVSESNTLAMPDIIDAIRAEGYEFGSLYELR